jgi:hypothetical protein
MAELSTIRNTCVSHGSQNIQSGYKPSRLHVYTSDRCLVVGVAIEGDPKFKFRGGTSPKLA